MNMKQISSMNDVFEVFKEIDNRPLLAQNFFDIDSIIAWIYKKFNEKFGIEGINISLLDDQGENLIPFKLYNPLIPHKINNTLMQMRIPVSHSGGFSIWAIQHQKPVFVKEFREEMIISDVGQKISDMVDIKSNLYFPLVCGKQILGIVTLPSYSQVIHITEENMAEIEETVLYLSMVILALWSLTKVQEKNSILMKRNEQIQRELNLAKNIQQSLIEFSFHSNSFNALALYKPMLELGGDFHAFYNLGKSQYGFFISDVSGHGASAALITTLVKGIIDSLPLEIKLQPSALLSSLNNHITDKIQHNFLTAFYGVYDSLTNTFIYSKAGHAAPYLLREKKLIELNSKGGILGFEKNMELTQLQIEIKKRDRIILFTDGVEELTNIKGKEYGGLFKDSLIQTAHLPTEAALKSIEKELVSFKGSSHFDDDVCLVIIDF